MKKLFLGVLVVAVLFAFMPLNAQLMPDKKVEPDKKIEPIEPVEPVEPKEEPKTEPKVEDKDKVKYELKIVYTKGMEFERTFKMNMKGETKGQGEDEAFDAKITINLNNKIIDVKDGVPIEIKSHFKDIKIEGEMPDSDEEDTKNMIKLIGHWVVVKIKDGEMKITEKSKDFPELEKDIFEEMGESTLMLFDSFEMPKKPVAVGESFKFNYKDMMFNEEMAEGIEQMGGAAENKEEFKLKLNKVTDVKGTKIASLSGKIEQKADFWGMQVVIKFEVSIELDITNNRCLKHSFVMVFSLSGANPQDGSEIKTSMDMNTGVTNNYGKVVKIEPKVEPKPKDDE